jgi:hypothetical protein
MDSMADDGVLMDVFSSIFLNGHGELARMVMDCTYKSLTLHKDTHCDACWMQVTHS